MAGTRGTDLQGSRATQSVTTPSKHCSDHEDSAPTIHVPLPGAANNRPISDGSKWINQLGVALSELLGGARGDIIRREAAAYVTYVAKTARQFLVGDGTDVISRVIETADLPSAGLTKADDTNVTLTLGGNHAAALLAAASLTLGWNGQLAPGRGGTGVSNVGTFTNPVNSEITGGGVVALGGFTLTVPDTGVAALLAVANVFTALNTFDAGIEHTPQATPSGNVGHVAYDSTKDRLVLQHEHHDFPVPTDPRNTCANQTFPVLYGTIMRALAWAAEQTFSATAVFNAGFTGTMSQAHTWQAAQAFSAGFTAGAASEIAATLAAALVKINQSGTGDILDLQDGGTSAVRFPDQGGVVMVPQAGGFQSITGLLGYDDTKDRLVLEHEHHDFPVPVDGRNTFTNYMYPIEYT